MKQKHAELIKLWADGAQIQVRDISLAWRDVDFPVWHPRNEYRLKPTPKPDIEHTLCVAQNLTLRFDKRENLRLIFDGETGNLKAATVI